MIRGVSRDTMSKLKITKIRRSIRRFTDYGSDLISSDFNTFDDRISKFCHFCETDEVFGSIHKQLREAASSEFDSWYEERLATVRGMVGSGQLTFPLDDDLRISYMYELIYRIHNETLSFRDIVHSFFAISSNRYDDYIYEINEAITTPMMRDIGYKLEEMEEELEEDENDMVFESSIQIIHHAENVIQQYANGSNINQTASINNTKLHELFEQLRSKAGSNQNDIETIEAAEEETKRSQPRISVVRTLLSGLSFSASVAGIISAILEIING